MHDNGSMKPLDGDGVGWLLSPTLNRGARCVWRVTPVATEYWVNIASGSCLLLTALSHYLHHWWLIIGGVVWHSFESNFTVSALATILHSDFENYTFSITATPPRGQRIRVKLVFTHSINTMWIQGTTGYLDTKSYRNYFCPTPCNTFSLDTKF